MGERRILLLPLKLSGFGAEMLSRWRFNACTHIHAQTHIQRHSHTHDAIACGVVVGAGADVGVMLVTLKWRKLGEERGYQEFLKDARKWQN